MLRYGNGIGRRLLALSAASLLLFLAACGAAEPQEVVREVPVEVVREVEVPVEREVVREVEVPVDREVVREVEREVVREVEVEVIKEVDKILVATPTPAAAPAAATVSAGHLRFTYTSLGSDGIYPKASNINAGGKDVNSTMYDVVIGSNAQGAFSKDTGLANDWSLTPDGKVHTINLRPGVQFHNGELPPPM